MNQHPQRKNSTGESHMPRSTTAVSKHPKVDHTNAKESVMKELSEITYTEAEVRLYLGSAKLTDEKYTLAKFAKISPMHWRVNFFLSYYSRGCVVSTHKIVDSHMVKVEVNHKGELIHKIV